MQDLRFYSSPFLISISADASLENAFTVMQAKKVRHLPVVDEHDAIVGMISDRDLLRASYFGHRLANGHLSMSFDPHDQVQNHMSWPVQMVDDTMSVSDAARLMIDKKISSLLIKRRDVVTGIITTEDLLKIFVNEHVSPLQNVKNDLLARLYNSPVGPIADRLSEMGL